MSKNEKDKEIIIVAETGFDFDDEQYINLETADSMEDARKAFIAKLKTFLGVEDYDDSVEEESFEDEYKSSIDAGKYVDYDENYLLQIKVI